MWFALLCGAPLIIIALYIIVETGGIEWIIGFSARGLLVLGILHLISLIMTSIVSTPITYP